MGESLTDELVDASRRFLDAHVAQPQGMDPQPLVARWPALRPRLAEIGWFDLPNLAATEGPELPAELGARLLRLAGSYLVPGPLVEAVLTVPWLLAQPDLNNGLLADHRLSLVTIDAGDDLPLAQGRPAVRLRAGRLEGSARSVLGACTADALLVHAVEHDAQVLALVPATHQGVRVEQLLGTDPCQDVAHVHLDCSVGEEHVIRSSDGCLPARLRARTRLGTAAYLAGISQRVLAFGVDHALLREQFGRPIGAFQAVQHLLADVAVIERSLANLVDFVAHELRRASDAEAVVVGAATKAQAGTDAVVACETVLQVLGGIGFTVEHPLHHYLKRALSLSAQYGSTAELHLVVGRSILARKESS